MRKTAEITPESARESFWAKVRSERAARLDILNQDPEIRLPKIRASLGAFAAVLAMTIRDQFDDDLVS